MRPDLTAGQVAALALAVTHRRVSPKPGTARVDVRILMNLHKRGLLRLLGDGVYEITREGDLAYLDTI